MNNETVITCTRCRRCVFTPTLINNSSDSKQYMSLECQHCCETQMYVVDLAPEFERCIEALK